jgi:preprotein translocase subunit SecA
MSQALTRYQSLYLSLRTRGRKEPAPSGLDRIAAGVKLRRATRLLNPSWLREEAERVHELEPSMRGHSERALDAVVAEVREAMMRAGAGVGSRAAAKGLGSAADRELVRKALGVIREVARRATGESAYIVQLMGALALYHGAVVEMLTGEGKTLTGSVAAPLIAWRRRRLHVFTVNDYLAARDAESRSVIYNRCLLDCGAIVQEQEPGERAEVYQKAIVYGTPKQITADYLRDQIKLGETASAWAGRGVVAVGQNSMVGGGSGPMVPGLAAAMIDEADAVLVDEGVVPLIIAQARRGDEMAAVYKDAARIAARLVPKDDYSMDLLRRRAVLTEKGKGRMRGLIEPLTDAVWRAPRRAEELVLQALVARHCYLHGQQYHVVDGRVVIVDEYTGRFMPDRSWEHGLHQAVEAKEGVDVTADRETLARLSFQRFFRMYPFMCGMTGTAADATVEIERVYQRRVVRIPTNKPVVRVDQPPRIFRTSAARWAAVVEEVRRLHKSGRPVLVGTRSIEASQKMSALLDQHGLSHKVLNALHDKEEATLVRTASEGGAGAAVLVATNMAGRGTDIKPDKAAIAAGGLAVVLTEMHGAERIDRQFKGRAGRQGDVGSSSVFLSLEDELLTLYTPRTAKVLRSMAVAGGDELGGHNLLLARRAFKRAQRVGQARARRGRSEVLKQDDWIEKHLPGM